jgi:hypothetical protein
MSYLVSTALALNVQFVRADSRKAVRKMPPPAVMSIVKKSTNLRDFIINAKPRLTANEFLFLMEKIKGLDTNLLPKIVEPKPGSFEIRLQKLTVNLDVVSSEKEIYSINGKTVELASLSLQDKLDLIVKTIVPDKSESNALWNLILPHADAEIITIGLAILGAILGIVSLTVSLVNQNEAWNRARCDEVVKGATSCLDLNGKLQMKVQETETFFEAQKEFLKKESTKSPEIATKTSEACKELTNQVAELQMTSYRGKSANQYKVKDCAFDVSTLGNCLDGLEKIDGMLKRFVGAHCSPASTTTAPPEKISAPPGISEAPASQPITEVLKSSSAPAVQTNK